MIRQPAVCGDVMKGRWRVSVSSRLQRLSLTYKRVIPWRARNSGNGTDPGAPLRIE
jgi:hypothetical protein